MSKMENKGAIIALLFFLEFTCSFGVEPLRTRLVGGSGPHEGRVEVLYDGAWGTVCDDGWDINDADVVCRSLGFSRALTFNHRSAFGHGEGRIALSNVRCAGTELNIVYCSQENSVNTCTHLEDAGVVCKGADPLPTRLVGGSGSNEGRVEVFYDGGWGTVCDDQWDIEDAHVVCRSLGYARASASNGSAAFGQGTGDIILDDVLCTGSEPNIAFCQYYQDGYKSHNCGHHEDAGVVCEGIVSARLRGGGSEREGRVEVLYNGEWGTVCDDQFDQSDAHVVCRMLGFSHAESLSLEFGPGSGAIAVDDLQCKGTERNIQECRRKTDGHNCGHDEDIGVTCVELPVRLVGSSSPNQGRVQLYHEGSWGSICDDRWDINDAMVVCHMLGYQSASEALTANPFPERGDDPAGGVLLDQVQCEGDETHIGRCQHRGFRPEGCDHDEDAGVVCDGKSDFRVRLVGGPDEAQGRVELFYFGAWGTACHLNWTSADSRVVCKMLGYPDVLDTAYHSAYGPGSGSVLLRQPRCSGKESTLMDCRQAYPLGITECDHTMDIGVTCLRPNALQVRLVGSQSRNEGRVEVKYQDSWGTVCDDHFDLNDANVVCRMLGYQRATNVSCCGAFGQGSGGIALDEVDCKGTESNLGECMRNVLGVHDCTHSEDVGVTCIGMAPLESKSDSSEIPLKTTLTYGMLGGLSILLVIFLLFSTFLVNKVKVYRDKSLRRPQRWRPVQPRPASHVLKTNHYGSYAQPAKTPAGLYPSLSIIKASPGKGTVKANEKGKTGSTGKVKPNDGKGSKGSGPDKPVVVVVNDSKKGMLTSFVDKLKLSR
ncbi:deleted in malignant brain tumors 1 protein-like [Lytechinus pictus]|uniref:deleted in malignant brain tumors 1 protein-like n=2 Tax=Lytechinus pictus TaxID=7653 RepID=UPI0030B9B152